MNKKKIVLWVLAGLAVVALGWGIYAFVKHEIRQSRRIDILDEFITVTFKDQVNAYLKARLEQ